MFNVLCCKHTHTDLCLCSSLQPSCTYQTSCVIKLCGLQSVLCQWIWKIDFFAKNRFFANLYIYLYIYFLLYFTALCIVRFGADLSSLLHWISTCSNEAPLFFVLATCRIVVKTCCRCLCAVARHLEWSDSILALWENPHTFPAAEITYWTTPEPLIYSWKRFRLRSKGNSPPREDRAENKDVRSYPLLKK